MKRVATTIIACAALAAAQPPIQVSEQAPSPLFWVTESTTAPRPTFDFHWASSANKSPIPDKLQSYAILLRGFPKSVGNTRPDDSHWPVFIVPGTEKTFMAEKLLAIRPGATPEPTAGYLFEFYALDAKLDLPADMSGQGLMKAVAGHVIAQTKWFDRAAPPVN